jgi:hypothetical protein
MPENDTPHGLFFRGKRRYWPKNTVFDTKKRVSVGGCVRLLSRFAYKTCCDSRNNVAIGGV